MKREALAREATLETTITALDQLDAGVFSVDPGLAIVHWNRFMATHSGRSADQVIGRDLFACFPDLPEPWLRAKLRAVFQLGTFAFSSWRQQPHVFRFSHDGPLAGGTEVMYQDLAFLPVAAPDGSVGSVCVLVTDATETALCQRAVHDAGHRLEREMVERRRIESELQISHKLDPVGQLAAGIAHEINTPIQHVTDSVAYLGEAFAEMRGIVQTYRQALYDRIHHPALEDYAALASLDQNIPAAVDRALMGLERVAGLVRAMTELGQPSNAPRAHADINRALATTVTVAAPEYRGIAEVELELGAVPEVPCHVAELNQVFLQLIANAAHAIAERDPVPARGEIRIRTWCDPDAVFVSVSDNGTGIPEPIRGRIFEPFFTTKAIGRGTGQGLAIARSIIVDRHAGTLSFDTQTGVGTTFVVRLPR